jgi:prepilin-type N-terminal cleavage/methylation domain-containing protein
VKVIHWHKRTRPAPSGSRPRPLEHRSGSDDGFTLIELIIVITIIPIIIAGISAAIITSFKDQAGIINRVSDSHDAQLTSAYFFPDVESASVVSVPGSGQICEPTLTGTPALELTEVNGNQTYEIFYLWSTNKYTPDLNQDALLRIVCGGSQFTAQVGTNTIVAHGVTSVTPSLSCMPTTPPTPLLQPSLPAWIACSESGGNGSGSAGSVESVSLTVTEVPKNGTTQLDSYTYNVSATPRAWVPQTTAATGGAPLPSLLLLASNTNNGVPISFTGAFNLTAIKSGGSSPGSIDVDSASPGSVSLFGGDTIAAPGGFNIYDCNPGGGSCTNGAVTYGTGGNSIPTATSMSSVVADPLGNLPTPNISVSGTGSCGAPVNFTVACSPGLYPNGLTISLSGYTYNFAAGGNYQFGSATCTTHTCPNTGLTVTGSGDTLNFASADYVFEGSTSDMSNCTAGGSNTFNNKGGINLTGGGNTLKDNGAGVLLYLAGGPANFGCNLTTDNTITLSPISTGQDAGVLLFASRTTTQNQGLILDGFTTAGTIYAPDCYVDVVGTAQNSTGSLVAQTLQLSGNLSVQ